MCGAVILLVSTSLHPMSADPNDPAAAFAEYAADRIWIATHLGQFVGVALLGVALVGVAATLEPGRPAAWAQVGLLGTAVSIATAAALQAVDGVALYAIVARWAGATGDAKARAFEAGVAVRQIEIGFASLTSLTFGLTLVAFGIAITASARYPVWLGWLGLAGGAGTLAAGMTQAYTGFSSMAMTVSMGSNVVLLVWAVLIGVWMWRHDVSSPESV
jgi:hypothetical protein